ncbi:MAG: TatD family hydrolase [Tannerellaceae bacterium]|nr:TatD family hydrolase [Tannerellaceae bacterium]
MRNLIDTHCHLYLEEFDQDREQLIDQAKKSGIELLLLPNVDTTTIEQMHVVCDQYPEFTYPMMGLHPTSVNPDYKKNLLAIESWLGKRDYCAIGEIGIDLYWDKTYLKEQKIVFEEQLAWSIELNLPVAIHTRNAFPEVFECIHKIGASQLKGVFHSFSGTETELSEIKKLGNFKIGINGVITFKNSRLDEIIRDADIQDILLETDAPYLSPVPYRGKRNEPVYIWETAKKVSDIYKIPVEETVKITKKNALNLFKNISNKGELNNMRG